MKLEFTIPGPPVPCARARVTSKRAFTPTATRAYEKRVAAFALQARCASKGWRVDWGSYRVAIEVHRSKDVGDADNYAKSILDGLTSIVFEDDAAVHEQSTVMHVAPASPRAVVVVETLGDETRDERRLRMRRERARDRRTGG